jgi:hypothetical protein
MLSSFAAWVAGFFAFLRGYKVFFGGLFLSILVVFLYNLVAEIVGEVLSWSLSVMSSETAGVVGESPSVGLDGVGAYLAGVLRVPEMLSVALNLVALKWLLRKIPFVRW